MIYMIYLYIIYQIKIYISLYYQKLLRDCALILSITMYSEVLWDVTFISNFLS